MKRILVIGSGGAGKSTFARRLGERLGLEVIHLDVHHWRPNWVGTPGDEWREVVEGLLRRDAWVMDGNFGGTLDVRMASCDTVIFLDLPRAVCLWRVLKRIVMYHNAKRPDMAEGCHERFDLEFLRWVWGYRARARPKVVRLLKEHEASKRIVWLRTRPEVEEFLTRAAVAE